MIKLLADKHAMPEFEYVKEVILHFFPLDYFEIFVTRLFDKKITNYKLPEYEDATTEKAQYKHTSYIIRKPTIRISKV